MVQDVLFVRCTCYRAAFKNDVLHSGGFVDLEFTVDTLLPYPLFCNYLLIISVQ